MEPITMGLIAGGAGLLGNIFGGIFSSGDREKAEQAFAEAMAIIEGLPNGPDMARPILLEKFQECKLPKIEVYFYTKIGEVACKHLFEIYEHSIYLGTDLAWSDSESLMTWKVSLLSPTEPVVTFGTDNHD